MSNADAETPRMREIRDELFMLENDFPVCPACQALFDAQDARREALVAEFARLREEAGLR